MLRRPPAINDWRPGKVTGTFILPLVKGMLLPLLVAASGHSERTRGEINERVDLIELNHHYDDLGRHNYDQVIFYEWCPEFKRFHVIAWCLVEDDDHRIPVRLPGSGDYRVRWHDRDAKAMRVVKASLFRETWSQVDPERANKRFLEEKYRLSLARAHTGLVR